MKVVKQIIYNVLESTRIIGLLLIPLLPELSTKINEQLGSIYREEIPWQKQLSWGLLITQLAAISDSKQTAHVLINLQLISKVLICTCTMYNVHL